jgi:hypothetical protein
MQASQGVSFPRSGHGAVRTIVELYFGGAFVYCDVNHTDSCGCESVPCINQKRTYSKNHDFALRRPPKQPRGLRQRLNHRLRRRKVGGVPIISTERYFIQYRRPVSAISSNFKLHLSAYPDHNHRAGWEKFAFKDLFYWNRFIDKWVLGFPAHARPPLYVSYESLLADPHARLRDILKLHSDGPLDEARVEQVLQRAPIAPKHSIAEFEFYDPRFFQKMEDATSGRLEKLGLPSFESDN